MNEEKLTGFVITFKNADDDSFAETFHRETLKRAISSARRLILTEYSRFDRKLNAVITSEEHPEEKPVVIKLDDILNKQ